MSSEEVERQCPILAGWSQLEVVVARVASHGKMVESAGKLTRQTCVDNADILIPLINELGGLTAIRSAKLFGICHFSKKKNISLILSLILITSHNS